jgi:hypothetical protein
VLHCGLCDGGRAEDSKRLPFLSSGGNSARFGENFATVPEKEPVVSPVKPPS